MRSTGTLLLFAIFVLFNSCVQGQVKVTKTDLSAVEFSEKVKAAPDAVILDVRTPEEFESGHLPDALNYDWNGDDFDLQIARLDESKPVFVYCLSGGRSSSAAQQMRSQGFSEVYEMSGGILKWRAANLPEVKGNSSISPGMTRSEFDHITSSDKLVLVDFYAEWCAPCKKMKPYLEEISKEMADHVTVVRIDVDKNQALSKELKIESLPVLHIYHKKTLQWAYNGYIDKAGVVQQLQ